MVSVSKRRWDGGEPIEVETLEVAEEVIDKELELEVVCVDVAGVEEDAFVIDIEEAAEGVVEEEADREGDG